tara:strand:+ start:222 stop:440 length:219 start_codon:yes stop_codon:yes gene_type:complete
MKFILIATALNLQFMYPSQEVCNIALDMVKEQDPKAICIPAGEQPIETMMESFFNMVKRLEEINQNKLTNKD